MKKSISLNNFLLVAVILSFFSLTFSSCSNTNKLRYFTDLPDSTHVFLPNVSKPERVIEYGDNLNIYITAEEKEAVAFFNAQGAASVTPSTPGAAATTAASGYLVDPLGFIEFPIIGKIKVLGLTERKLKETLTQLIGKYVKSPLVDVRFTTFRVTVLGEVGSPGTFTLPMQRTTIFEVLGAAGDLGPNGKRYDVQLYRDYGGERAIIKFDLSKRGFLTNAEVFEIRHNDVLYVQPLRNQIFREDFSFIASMVGLLTGFVSLGFIIFKN